MARYKVVACSALEAHSMHCVRQATETQAAKLTCAVEPRTDREEHLPAHRQRPPARLDQDCRTWATRETRRRARIKVRRRRFRRTWPAQTVTLTAAAEAPAIIQLEIQTSAPPARVRLTKPVNRAKIWVRKISIGICPS